MVVSNSVGKIKLKYDDIRDLVLAEEVRRKDSGELLGLGSALNVDYREKGNNRDYKSSNKGRLKSKNRGKNRSYSGLNVCWNFQKPGHFKKYCRNPKAEENNSANVVTKDVDDVLLLANHITVDDWVLDSGSSFHTTSHKEIITNYVDNDFGKVYLANGQSLDVMGIRDVSIKQPNGSVWKL